MSKACTKCGEWKKNSEFGAHKRSTEVLTNAITYLKDRHNEG